MKYLVANWKSNKTIDEAREWLEHFKGYREKDDLRVILCPPYPYLFKMKEWLDEFGVEMRLGVQDVSPYPYGTYTGAVAAGMVKSSYSMVIV